MSLFKALGDPTRRAILDLLRAGDRTAGEIADALDLTPPAASHHLTILRTAELVTSQKDGRYVRYALATTTLEEATGWLLGLIDDARQPDASPDALPS